MPAVDKLILPALQAVKLCAVTQVVLAARPVCEAFLYFSDHYPPAVGCDCSCAQPPGGQGTLWARYVQGQTDLSDIAMPMDCTTGRMSFTIEVGVWRCAPMGEYRTAPIAPGETWPEGMMHDLAALRRAFICCDWFAEQDMRPRITTMTPIGPSGGCVGAAVRAELTGADCRCPQGVHA